MLDGRGVSGKVNNFGLGLSAEVGKKFGLTKDFFVEPQAQLAYYWIKGKDFSMSNGMKVEQGDFNSWVGRLGSSPVKTSKMLKATPRLRSL